MSTNPTEILETTAPTVAEALESAAAETLAAATEATEAGLDFSAIKEAMDAFDPAALLPEVETIFGSLVGLCRIAVMVGPIVILILGLCYLFLVPKEANHYFGYRTYFGMGSINAWQYTQRLAGLLFTGLGGGLCVAMLLLAAGFGQMGVMDMVWRAVACLGWQAGLILAVTLFINLAAAVRFDRKGAFRKRKR